MTDEPLLEILVECAACEGSGEEWDWRNGDWGHCTHCGGTGREMIEAEPVTCEDLDPLVPA